MEQEDLVGTGCCALWGGVRILGGWKPPAVCGREMIPPQRPNAPRGTPSTAGRSPHGPNAPICGYPGSISRLALVCQHKWYQ